MSPHNCSYPELLTHLREADIGFVAPGAVVSKEASIRAKEYSGRFAEPLQLSE